MAQNGEARQGICSWLQGRAVCTGQPPGLGFWVPDAASWTLPLVGDSGVRGEGPEETHHLTGGEADSLMPKREGETKEGVRAAGSPPAPHCPAPQTSRAERWPPQCLSLVPARRCPRLPHPHPKEAEGLLHPDPWVLHRELTHHGAMCGLQPRSSGESWCSALPAGGVPGPLVGMWRRVSVAGPPGGRGRSRFPCSRPLPPQPPSLALSGARAGAGVPGGRQRLGEVRRAARTG